MLSKTELQEKSMVELEALRKSLITTNAGLLWDILKLANKHGTAQEVYRSYNSTVWTVSGWTFRTTKTKAVWSVEHGDFKRAWLIEVIKQPFAEVNVNSQYVNVVIGSYVEPEDYIRSHNYLRPGEWMNVIHAEKERWRKEVERTTLTDAEKRKVEIIKYLTGD